MLSSSSKKIKVAVHDGIFHADEVFSVVILSLHLNKQLKIFRTRDQKILSEMDYILDVGREYNPKEHKFDHHQVDWNEKRENGVYYATCGLLWREYGEKICGSYDVAKKVDEKVIQSIDAEDNGIELYKNIIDDISPYCVVDYIFSINPTWTEKNIDSMKCFQNAVQDATKILKREIKKAKDNVLGIKKVKKIYEKAKDKRILILDEDYSWKKIISSYPEPLFVIKQVYENKSWHVKAVNEKGVKFKNRLDFPINWAGKEGKELAEITGVPDAIFCHNKRFMAAAMSKEGAIKLAELAIKEGSK
jgi:uncharacterized UPF0160 family protein